MPRLGGALFDNALNTPETTVNRYTAPQCGQMPVVYGEQFATPVICPPSKMTVPIDGAAASGDKKPSASNGPS